MDFMNQDVWYFFDLHQTVLPLHEVFVRKIEEQFPDTKSKSLQIHLTIHDLSLLCAY